MMNSNVALVVGVTGIVGMSLLKILQSPDASGGPWRVIGIARRGFNSEDDHPFIDLIQCDLLDESETKSKLSHLSQVTHIFWVTWTGRDTEEANCQVNSLMFSNFLGVMLPVARRSLKHICLQTGVKHYLGSHFTFNTSFAGHTDVPFEEGMPRLPGLNFYYDLEDVLHRTCELNPGLTWSVHRPNIIFGFGPRSQVSLLRSLAIYATVCKHEGLSFEFPGDQRGWEALTNFSDADLIAEQQVWAATHPEGKNQAFNVDNGDCITWKRLWSVLAREFNLELPEYSGKPISLVERMAGKEESWREIVRNHGLVETEINPGTWMGIEVCFNFLSRFVTCMNKSKEAGFLNFRNTASSTRYWIRVMKDRKLIPGDEFWTRDRHQA